MQIKGESIESEKAPAVKEAVIKVNNNIDEAKNI